MKPIAISQRMSRRTVKISFSMDVHSFRFLSSRTVFSVSRNDHSGFSAENRDFFFFVIAGNYVDSALSYKKYMIIKVQNNTK